MKISDHINSSHKADLENDFEQAIMFACIAVDGTAKKTYPKVNQVGVRFKRFIEDNVDIIEFMFGGINLEDTNFPFFDNKGNIGMKFHDIIYEKYRCNLVHGEELEEGYGVDFPITKDLNQFRIDTIKRTMTMPRSCITALAFACVLAPVNADQEIGNSDYYYYLLDDKFYIDKWWGKLEEARKTLDMEKRTRITMDFSRHWPKT